MFCWAYKSRHITAPQASHCYKTSKIGFLKYTLEKLHSKTGLKNFLRYMFEKHFRKYDFKSCHRPARASCTAMKLPTEESSKFLPSNFHLYFKSRANFVGCRGSQMPIKECKMFYRSFKTHFPRCKLFSISVAAFTDINDQTRS